jgi:pyruvate dehydrogenase E2 component (dihydrolipoamide acetyltransferase)
MSQVKVPDIGDFSDVPVIEVLVAVGDEVEAEQGLVTLESDKATMEVPAPHAGVVEELLVAEGDTVSEGDPVAVISGGDGGDGDEAGESSRAVSVEAEKPQIEPGPAAGEDAPADPGTKEESTDGAEVYASPSVRRIARQKGIDLSGVKGTGRKSRITVEDVEAFADGRGQDETHRPGGAGAPGAWPGAGQAADVADGPPMAPWPTVDHAKYGEVERVELSRIRQISGPNLTRNWAWIPHVTHHDEADITELEAFRKQVNSEQDVKVTMVALLLKAVVPVLKQYPEFNSSLDGDGLILKRYWHIGFAVDTPDGLLVPVIRDVDRKGLLEVAAELAELSGKAREGKLGSAEMSGATFTISSLGGIGGTGFTPIVNAPQVAILGVTRSQMKPVWDAASEQFVPRLMVPLSLSYDHRVIDGAAAARFCVSLVKVLEDFRRIVL